MAQARSLEHGDTLRPTPGPVKTGSSQEDLSWLSESPFFKTPPGTAGLKGAETDIFSRTRSRASTHWSVPWSDLMMTMFVLFAVLYAFHASSSEPSAAEPDPNVSGTVSVAVRPRQTPSGQEMQRLYTLSRQTMMDEDLKQFASVDLVPDQAVRIVLTGDLLFDTGRADIKAQALGTLRKVGSLLGKTPYVINVVGHTDDQPIHTEQFPSNWELSSARACQVARFLIEEHGLPADRFYISGHASFQPIDQNDDPLGQARNRRVEIIITKDRPQGTGLDLKSPSHADSTAAQFLAG